ncbi:MAG: vWA domain-containing protein [Sandaracinaceae bacterium]
MPRHRRYEVDLPAAFFGDRASGTPDASRGGMRVVVPLSAAAKCIAFAVLGVFFGCGARTGLDVPVDGGTSAPDAAQPDSGPTPDGGRDGGVDGGSDGGPDAGPDAGPPTPPCIEVPFGGGRQTFRIGFDARIQAADIVFLVDNTGSMGPLINEVEALLRTRIVPGLERAIPDLQMAVAIYRDFGFAPFGNTGDEPFERLQVSTSSVDDLERAVMNMAASGGGDTPESALEALYQLATGEGLGGYIPPADCPPDTVGAACLRPDAVPLVLLFTDAPFHNGPSHPATYSSVRPRPHTYPETLDALAQAGLRVVGVFAGGSPLTLAAQRDLQAIAADTGAVDAEGAPIVTDLGGDRRPRVSRLLDAVTTLVDDSRLSVDAVATDVAGDTIDATRFIRLIRPLRAIPSDGATVRGGRFESVTPGTRVEFEIVVENDFVSPDDAAQRFPFRVTLRDDGVAPLTSEVFEVIVPGRRGPVCP